MKTRRLVDLTDEEIIEVITESINALKVTNISRDEKYDEIDCVVTTEYEDDGSTFSIDDSFTLRNPFENPIDFYNTNFELGHDELLSIIQYCYAKGVVSREWVTDNKWLEEKK